MLPVWLEDGIYLFDSYSIEYDDKYTSLQGVYSLNVEVKNKLYQDKFDLIMVLDIDKQKEIPKVYLQNRVIPRGFEHVYPYNNNLCCLGVNYEIIQAWGERTFLNFLQNVLNPYLVNFLEFTENQQYIDGDRPHALQGILEYYGQFFHRVSQTQLKDILQYCYKNIKRNEWAKGHNLCPCKSGEKIRHCIHNEDIKTFICDTLKNEVLKLAFLADFKKLFS